MPHPNAEGENVRLSALAWIIVQAPPATAKLTPPQSIYLKDTDGAVNIDWSVENATTGASQSPTLTITRVTEDNNTTKVVASERLSGTSGSYSLPLQSVQDGNLKDTYQVVLSVENPGEESLFYDGAGYADHCQLKLIKTVGVPTIKTSMTAPNYEIKHENTNVIYQDMLIPLLADKYLVATGADNPDFVALSNTIRILDTPATRCFPATPPILSAIPNRRQHRV